jgi:hypothetical protein
MSAKVAAGIRAREAARHPKPVVVHLKTTIKSTTKIVEPSKVEPRVDEIAEDEFSGELPE